MPTPTCLIGLDVGSTTAKVVAVRRETGEILWHAYERHEARPREKAQALLARLERALDLAPEACQAFVTGIYAPAVADALGARVVQEVAAVALAAERRHPDARAVVDLGGQDAKILVFEDGGDGRRRTLASMNDKCAGGTGAVIDKIAAKLKIDPAALGRLGYHGRKLHPIAGKCGVFAETDINSLQKQGVAPEDLMASLFEAIVIQNLTVLARGRTLRPRVLLVGGPHAFLAGLRDAWRAHLARLWRERGVELPPGAEIETLVTAPAGAEYFTALGAVELGRDDTDAPVPYRGAQALASAPAGERRATRRGVPALAVSGLDLATFRARFARPAFAPPQIRPGESVRGFVGLDVGSTSAKAVVLSEAGEVVAKAYQLSRGNPIEDARDMFRALRAQIEQAGGRLDVAGLVTTGYAKDIVKDVFGADAALVETVAHARSALQRYRDPHVIVDVGGQDIKIIVLREGRVQDFRLNTQCSAGNGYFLQAIAESLGYPVERFAEAAFSATEMPVFGYGCVLFLQSEIANFQRQGWRPEEILAGLAAVLPKNVFLYVAKAPNLARLGTRFVLQGGTQRNLAAVKAEVDFILENFRGHPEPPEIVVHEHCGEAGAIGAALEAIRLFREGRRTSFVGLDAAERVAYRAVSDETTRCHFCKNACQRTVVEVRLPDAVTGAGAPPATPAGGPAVATRRFVSANCEKGQALDLGAMREIKSAIDAVKARTPNLVAFAAREVWRPRHPAPVADPPPAFAWTRAARARAARYRERPRVRVGIPRVFNMYSLAPLFSAYLESLGVPASNIVYSDYTSPELYRQGAGRGAIDPCFPSKVAVAHVHNLLEVKHRRAPLTCIFFPMIDEVPSPLVGTLASNACPTVALTPQTVRAAFTREGDEFAARGVQYLAPLLNLTDRRLFSRQMFDTWAPILGLSREEHERALAAGFEALAAYETDLRRRARAALDEIEREDRLGVVILGRPYHHDPGLNHEIPDELQKLGYAVFSQSTLPFDEDLLERLFGEEVRAGLIRHPLDISDVWKNSLSASSNLKIWAAKFTARHPNLVAVELSNFKCGHDAPIYSVVQEIIECSGTPYFAFKDVDENRPVGAIRLRLETIDYALKRYRETLVRRRRRAARAERHLAAYARRVREALARGAGDTPAPAPAESTSLG
jgi:activator of 2-hydroxyglutaryl-CoA dehydratase/predicted nucleotide-binding protein (sugar kinase/HSP70/actin superfamily)